ncbi:MAG: acyltransferase [Candidatus Omnitrophica bacterium]|nr:acyltransferase [Candidatus Omnitrophota bacterium]
MAKEKKSNLKLIVNLFFKVLICAAYKVYKIDGICALLYFMPPSLIVPTLRKYGAHIGDNVIVHGPLVIHNAKKDYKNLEIGDESYLGREAFLDLTDKMTLGKRVIVSMRATLLTHFDAGGSSISKIMPAQKAPLNIEDDVYIGASVTIKGGVTIHKGSLVAAMSFVNRDAAEKTMVGGVPAVTIKNI